MTFLKKIADERSTADKALMEEQVGVASAVLLSAVDDVRKFAYGMKSQEQSWRLDLPNDAVYAKVLERAQAERMFEFDKGRAKTKIDSVLKARDDVIELHGLKGTTELPEIVAQVEPLHLQAVLTAVEAQMLQTEKEGKISGEALREHLQGLVAWLRTTQKDGKKVKEKDLLHPALFKWAWAQLKKPATG